MDGSAFIFRGFYANQHLRRSDGFPTNALVVVTRILLRILREERPRYFLFVKDGHGPTFRHRLYPQYKANRASTPEELTLQVEPILRMVAALGIAVEVSDGCEADDCIASLAKRFSTSRPVVMISGDKDLKQCLGPRVFLWDPAPRPALRAEKVLTADAFTAEMGIPPDRWSDMQALMGDAIDNIPGVPGIGPKTAQKIFALCTSLEDIRDHLDRLPRKLQDKLRDHLDDMFRWRQLTTLLDDASPHVRLEDIQVRPLDATQCAALADEFELQALRREMSALARLQASPSDGGDDAADLLLATPHIVRSPTAQEKQAVLPYGESASADAPSLPGGPAALDAATLFAALPTPPTGPVMDQEAQLPACAGRRVAVLWPEKAGTVPHLAVEGGEEFRWLGPLPTLRAWLAEADSIVTADAKARSVREVLPCSFPAHSQQPPRVFDLGLAAYLLNPEELDYEWPRLVARLAPSLLDTAKPASVPGAAILALRMARMLEERLEAACLWHLYLTLELPLIPVLADMEAQGVRIDAAAFRAFLDDVQRQIDSLSERIFTEVGQRFNLRSAQQLADVLFEKLKLPAPRKTKGGQASTSQESLEKLATTHPVVDNILQFRKLEKMRSTYLEPLPRLVDSQGRIHTTFNQKATATGRLSSSNPNLQNIPVRGPLGRRMRACFVAEAGRTLIAADYSQVELRVLAHMSQDAALLDAFRQGTDIHARTAALIYDVSSDAVTPDQRRTAKTINFGLLYGMGAQKLARELHISPAEAKAFIARYFARLGGLKAFYAHVEAEAKELGYVTTLGGRRRLLPGMHSSNGQTYALARRQAINTVIQGSAADIIKLAMLAVADDAALRAWDARLLLQIHDELLLEAPTAVAAKVGARVAALMGDVRPGGQALDVPLLVDWGTGNHWGEAHA